jgi:hypothetical protein
MDSGTMNIVGLKGQPVVLTLSPGYATANGSVNPLVEVQRALYRERASRSPIEHNIAFLSEWLTQYESQAPVVQRYKLGKRAPIYDARTLQLKKYTATLKPSPHFVDYESVVTNFPIYGNDSLGDCVAAAAGHMVQSWTANAGNAFNPTLEDVINFYKYSGYNPSDPNTDQGWELLPALKNWRAHGIAGHKIVAFVQLETGNFEELKQSIALFGNAYLGFALPDWAVPFDGTDWTQIPWIWREGGTPDPNNGHCVPAMGYNKKKWVNFVSWAARMGMDEEFYKNASDEAWAVVTTDWIMAEGRSPSGFDIDTLLKDLSEVTGQGKSFTNEDKIQEFKKKRK